MPLRRHDPALRLKRWESDDWYFTPAGYRFIKATFHSPVAWASKLQVKGAENVPATGPVILAVNHFSWADPVIVGVVLKRPAFYLAKERLFHNRAARAFLESFGQIRVDRDAGGNDGALATAVGLLEQGLVVGVFPEGTRSRYGETKRGKTGVARIAARSGAPVVPIAITTADMWPKGQALPRLRTRVYANVGAPLRLDLKPDDADDRQKMRDATDQIMDRVRALLGEANAARDADARWGA